MVFFVMDFVAHPREEDKRHVLDAVLLVHLLQGFGSLAIPADRVFSPRDNQDVLIFAELSQILAFVKLVHSLKEFMPEAMAVHMAAIRIGDITLDVLLVVGKPIHICLAMLDRFRIATETSVGQESIGFIPILFRAGQFGHQIGEAHLEAIAPIGAHQDDLARGSRIELKVTLHHEGAHRMAHDRGLALAPKLIEFDIRSLDVLIESADEPLLLVFDTGGVQSLANRIENIDVIAFRIEVLSDVLIAMGMLIHSGQDNQVLAGTFFLKGQSFLNVAIRQTNLEFFHVFSIGLSSRLTSL